MLNPKTKERELAYVVKIDDILPIEGADRVEVAVVGGWRIMVRKGQFMPGDFAVYFEIDSQVPAEEPFMFLAAKHFKIKTQKYFKGKVLSQGLLMSFEDFRDEQRRLPSWLFTFNLFVAQGGDWENDACRFLTKELGVKYSSEEDNKRKSSSVNKYKKMAGRHPKLFRNPFIKWLYKKNWGKKLLFVFFGKVKNKKNGWPVGRFSGVSKTDQERCENMPWILEDKTPFIVTQKCDGSSGTYILEKVGKNKYEFYVCSRNVRMLKEDQECYYGSHNYYWEVAKKYDIENKMKEWLSANPTASWVCWQGEICAPGIQKNPHKLSETHFYCFHWTDNVNGRLDIISAKENWEKYNMEIVPIVNTEYILPDDFEEFKQSADGNYSPEVCEGHSNCEREGFVYYKTTDPTYSFKNVSRTYLLNH